MKKFEYKTLKLGFKNAFQKELKEDNIEKKLNELGILGWELTSSISNSTSGGTKEIVLIFKRLVV